jgi:hypothetical protein
MIDRLIRETMEPENLVRPSMSGFSQHFGRPARVAAFITAALFSISSGAAGATCGLCDTEIVMNAELASCFLEQYDKLAQETDPTIVVDLSGCESRGIVDALPSLDVSTEQPDTEFMISRAQLDCLRKKLQDPNIKLDPSAKIDLSSCG